MEGTFTRFGPDGSIFMTHSDGEREFQVDPKCKAVGDSPTPGDRIRIDGQPAVRVENLSRPEGTQVHKAAAKGFYGTSSDDYSGADDE